MNIIERVIQKEDTLNEKFSSLFKGKGIFSNYNIPQFDGINLRLNEEEILEIMSQEFPDISFTKININEDNIVINFFINTDFFESVIKRSKL